LDAQAVGLAAVALGAGRDRLESRVDPAVGFTLHRKVGDTVRRDELLAEVAFNDDVKGEEASRRLLQSYEFGPHPPVARPLIMERLV
jgi:pyrimidine-nucleoside phosphorylase